ncbi:uncharacterized protein TNCV_233081 [Trichonephila clavipes]|nr:uncharacterized protein TNCV_233081 [Trichonephila clavipes]
MDANMRTHRAHLVDKFLEIEDIRRMIWPFRFPGLIPVVQECQTLKLTLANQTSQDIIDGIENFCNISFNKSHQHSNSTDAGIYRDDIDVKLLVDFFIQHRPFPDTDAIISIATGIAGDKEQDLTEICSGLEWTVVNRYCDLGSLGTFLKSILGAVFSLGVVTCERETLEAANVEGSVKVEDFFPRFFAASNDAAEKMEDGMGLRTGDVKNKKKIRDRFLF